MKMLSYSLPSIHDGGCSVNQLRRQVRIANPDFFVMNVFRLMDGAGPTSSVSIDLRLKMKQEVLQDRRVVINGKQYTAKPVWINRRRSPFDMRSVLEALPDEVPRSRKKTRLSYLQQ